MTSGNFTLPGPRFLQFHWRGWLTIVGLVMAYTISGTAFMYGYIGEIVVSYFHNHKSDQTMVNPAIPLQMLGQCLLALAIFNPMGPLLFNFFQLS